MRHPIAFYALMVLLLSTTFTHARAMDATPPEEMPAGTYKLDDAHASLVWQVSHLGLSNYTARFTDMDATLHYTPENPEQSTVEVTINPLSIETDYPYPEKQNFDATLAKDPAWFNAEKFPSIRFTSTQLTRKDEHTGTMTGDLTFLGVTKPVTLDVTFNGAMLEQPFSKKPTLGFSARGELSRSNWGMTKYIPQIGDEVELIIEVEFAKDK